MPRSDTQANILGISTNHIKGKVCRCRREGSNRRYHVHRRRQPKLSKLLKNCPQKTETGSDLKFCVFYFPRKAEQRLSLCKTVSATAGSTDWCIRLSSAFTAPYKHGCQLAPAGCLNKTATATHSASNYHIFLNVCPLGPTQ